MDYVVGSVAALISGNVTPNRPKLIRRALTPTKHQPSPNVTPKSEFVEDRSIFLSPTQQKKKAIVKKSPKRIFQNPDLDVTENCEGNSSLTSPKAEKVKKHLKEELEAENMGKKKSKSPSSTLDKSSDDVSPAKKPKVDVDSSVTNSTPKKKKNKRNSESNSTDNDNAASETFATSKTIESNTKSPKKKQRKSISEEPQNLQTNNTSKSQEISQTNLNELGNQNKGKKNKKQKKKNKNSQQNVELEAEDKENSTISTEINTDQNLSKKKKKSHKNKTKTVKPQEEKMEVNSESESEEVKSTNVPNPNAITEKDSDSEHDSDDEIESENEQENEKVLTNENGPPESSDEEGEEEPKPSNDKQKENKGQQVMTEDEIKRTLFVGNVPFSKKCKKEIKKIFSKHGQIETIRIRTIPVKDARVTPKLAVIKQELHPERSTVNVYVKYAHSDSVGKAIAENNTVLNGNHLRVSRSDCTGSEHDPHCAVFVGNLPFAVEDDVLRSKFDKCGEIVSVRIIRDRKTNAGKGFGYINFASKDGVELALALSEEDLTIKNRIMRVKRCTVTQGKSGKQGGKAEFQGSKPGYQGAKPGFHGGRPGYQGGKPGYQGGKPGYQGGKPGYQGGKPGYQGGKPGYQGGKPGYQGGKPGFQGGRQGNQSMRQGNQGGRPSFQGGNQNQGGGGNWSQQGGKWGEQGPEGAARRLMNKRKFQESGEGPAVKRPAVDQPAKEKKQRKEFVGMTADKKKKHKFDKGQKKKKALSEILTKKS